MDHRGDDEFQTQAAEVDAVTVSYPHHIVSYAIEASDHFESLGVADNCHVRKHAAEHSDRAGMVRLHMVYHQIVRSDIADGCDEIFTQTVAGTQLHAVDQRRFRAAFHYI